MRLMFTEASQFLAEASPISTYILHERELRHRKLGTGCVQGHMASQLEIEGGLELQF